MGHHEREAWIMAAILPVLVLAGIITGIVLQNFFSSAHH
jgi:hypothetical protein